MNRRDFLRVLGIGTAVAASTAVLDPEALMWVPGRTSYFDLGASHPIEIIDGPIDFVPAYKNSLLTVEMITKEALSVLENNLIFMKGIDHFAYLKPNRAENRWERTKQGHWIQHEESFGSTAEPWRCIEPPWSIR